MQDIIQLLINKTDNAEKCTILAEIINNLDEDSICDIVYNIMRKNENIVNRIVIINPDDNDEVITKKEITNAETTNDVYYSFYSPEWEYGITNEIATELHSINSTVKKYGYANIYNSLRSSILVRMENESYENYNMSFEDFDVTSITETKDELSVINEILLDGINQNVTDQEIVNSLSKYVTISNANPIKHRIIAHSTDDVKKYITDGKKLCWNNDDCNLSYCTFMHVPISKMCDNKSCTPGCKLIHL
jgi:hypothetical protein